MNNKNAYIVIDKETLEIFGVYKSEDKAKKEVYKYLVNECGVLEKDLSYTFKNWYALSVYEVE